MGFKDAKMRLENWRILCKYLNASFMLCLERGMLSCFCKTFFYGCDINCNRYCFCSNVVYFLLIQSINFI